MDKRFAVAIIIAIALIGCLSLNPYLILLAVPIVQIEEKVRTLKQPFKLHKHLTDLLDGFKYSVKEKNFSRVIVIDGKSGYGKSTLMSQVGTYLDPTFSLDKVHFIPQGFLDGLAYAKKEDCVVLDEAMLISSRSTMSSLNRIMITAMSMIRSKNIYVILCINSAFDLDRNLILHRADLLLHVYNEGLTGRGRFMAFYTANDQIDRIKGLYFYGKKFYDYGKPKSNFNTTFSAKFMFNEDAYESKKQIGINLYLRGDGEENSFFKLKKSRDSYIKYLKENTNLNADEIAEIGGISKRTVFNVLKRNDVK